MKDFKDMQFKITRDTDRGLHHYACGRQNMQLNTYDWLYDVPGNDEDTDLVEVQFKNTRKGYYHNVNHIDLHRATSWRLRQVRVTTSVRLRSPDVW